MPWSSIRLRPGLNAELTETLNQAGYTAIDLGRFKNGLFQKLGGWTKHYENAVDGVPSALHAHQDLSGNNRLTIGTDEGLFDITSSNLKDISPQTKTTNSTVNFATTIGSPVVTIVDSNVSNITVYDSVYFNTPISVGGIILSGAYGVTANISATSYTITADTDATATVASPGGAVPTFTTTAGDANVTIGLNDHGLVVGNEIVFPISTTIGGIDIEGRYTVQSVPGANSFTITASVAAASTAGPTSMNSGNAQFLYYIALGPQVAGSAYGSGLYGAGAYGLGIALSGQTGTALGATNWALDNWGELAIAVPEDGGIYYWGSNSGYQNVSLIPEAPLFNTGAFVSIAQQVIVAYGSTQDAGIGVYQDPMLVRWCDVGDFTDWTATITNQAGAFRIPTGSEIIGGAATPHRNLIWTDLDLWSMDYIGATLAFGFNKIGSNCGLISKHAHAQLSDIIFWMGKTGFYYLSGGGVKALPCPVWDMVFQDIDEDYYSKCFAGANPSFSEVWFFYPSASGGYGYCDKYVKYNVVEGTWDAGTLSRTAWISQSVLGSPIATTPTSIIYSHESGNDADSSPIISSFSTGWFYIDEGREVVFVDAIYPDFKWSEYNGSEDAEISITISSVMYPGDTPVTYGPFTVTSADQYIKQRLRGRQVKLTVSSSDTGSFWRLGLIRFRWAMDGRR